MRTIALTLLTASIAAIVGGQSLTASQKMQQTIEGARENTRTCEGAKEEWKAECATAEQAAAPLVACNKYYGIDNGYEQAAVLSMITFETADFKYNINHFPGRLGQGTRNMQMPEFNAKYASDVLGADNPDFVKAKDNPEQILMLLNQTVMTWCSGAWFMAKQCNEPGVRTELQSGKDSGWHSYLKKCIGTGDNPEPARDEHWVAFKKYADEGALPVLLA